MTTKNTTTTTTTTTTATTAATAETTAYRTRVMLKSGSASRLFAEGFEHPVVRGVGECDLWGYWRRCST
jgi:hypothetical protein